MTCVAGAHDGGEGEMLATVVRAGRGITTAKLGKEGEGTHTSAETKIAPGRIWHRNGGIVGDVGVAVGWNGRRTRNVACGVGGWRGVQGGAWKHEARAAGWIWQTCFPRCMRFGDMVNACVSLEFRVVVAVWRGPGSVSNGFGVSGVGGVRAWSTSARRGQNHTMNHTSNLFENKPSYY